MKIAVLTSGGDAPGMNAAIRAVVRYADYYDIEVYGVERGYAGLIAGNLSIMSRRSVSDIIQRGGTKLRTARSAEFETYEGQKQAAKVLSFYGIDGLVVIGGDGSFRGLQAISKNFGVKGVGIPGTIDNDLSYTDYTLGFDTAVNTCVSAINNLRDTMSSHDRVVVVQVMGRRCGDLALYSALSGGAEIVMVPEHKTDYDQISRKLKRNVEKGKQSGIIVLAEGASPLDEVVSELKARTGLSFRSIVLGHIQRGGAPSMADRVLATRMGAKAVDLLRDGMVGARVVGIKDNAIIDMDIEDALNVPRHTNEALYELANIVSR